jgi:two-component system cell cycle sensor histidine kinase/response regulator CckA
MPTLEREGAVDFVTGAVRGTATVLVADDDPTVLQVAAMNLDRSGYNVLTAQEGAAALRVFEEAQQTIQLVISDVIMPGLTGPQLVRSIKNLSPSTAVLLMSCTQPIVSEAGIALIVKPFTRKALIATVRGILGTCDFAKIEREQSIARAQRLAARFGSR